MNGTSASDHIDPLILGEVRELIGDHFCLLLKRYLKDSFNLLSRMSEAVERGRVSDLVECCHQLASGSYAVGATQLAALCSTLEAHARLRSARDLPRLLREIQREYAAVSGLLEEEICLSEREGDTGHPAAA